MRIQPLRNEVAIVLIGRFNPAIFRPGWFSRLGLFSDEATESAEIEVIHNELSSFTVDWARILVQKNRFQVASVEYPFVRLSDFVQKVFGEYLPHTPIAHMGINRQITFNAPSHEARDSVGCRLAPIDAWGKWSQKLRQQGTDSHGRPRNGGMLSLTMHQGARDDGYDGHIQTRIQPDNDAGPAAINMRVNDHYEVGTPDEVYGCSEIVQILANRFEASLAYSESIIDEIMRISKGEK